MKTLLTLLILFCLTTSVFAVDSYHCDKHGELTENEVITITIWEEDFHLCQKCVLEFIENNSEEVGRIIKHIKRQK